MNINDAIDRMDIKTLRIILKKIVKEFWIIREQITRMLNEK